MAFRVGAVAKVWDVKPGKNSGYCMAEMSTSRKTQSGEYEQDWANKFVMLCGDAVSIMDGFQKGMTVRIGECAVTNKWDKEKKVMYTNYAIYSFQDDSGSSGGTKPAQKKDDKKGFMEVPDTDSEELPFN